MAHRPEPEFQLWRMLLEGAVLGGGILLILGLVWLAQGGRP